MTQPCTTFPSLARDSLAARDTAPGWREGAGMITVSIIVPTFRRPDSLRRTLSSCLRQQGVDPTGVEIVVVDNCPEGSAADAVGARAADAPMAIRYRHETRPGVSHARNAGVRAARAERLAFIDDDEEVSEGWLAALL